MLFFNISTTNPVLLNESLSFFAKLFLLSQRNPAWNKVINKTEQENIVYLYDELKIQQEELLVQNEQLQKTELELTYAKTHFESVFELSPSIIVEIDESGVVRRANSFSVRVLGLKRNLFVDFGFSSKVKAVIADYLTNSTSELKIRSSLKAKDRVLFGELRIVCIKSEPTFGNRYIVAFEDKTKLRLINKLLKKQLNDINNLVDASGNYFLLTTLEGQIVSYNKSAVDFIHSLVPNAPILDERINLYDIAPDPFVITLSQGLHNAALGKKYRGEVNISVLNIPTVKWLEYLFIPVTDIVGKINQVGIVIYNITEQKQRETDLQRLAMVAERTINGVVITDAQRKIEWINKGFERLTGYTYNEVVGKKPGEILQTNQTGFIERKIMTKALDRGKPVSVTLLNRRKSGEDYFVNVKIEPILNEIGEVEKFFAIQTDVTSEVQLLAEYKEQAKKLQAAKDELASLIYRISHDLRAPVVSSLGLVSLMEMQLNNIPDDHNNYLQLQKKSLKKMDEYITEIVNIVKNERFELHNESIDLNDLFETEKTKLAHLNPQVDVVASFNIKSELISDKFRICIIIGNLMSNGIKYANGFSNNKMIVSFNFEVTSSKFLIKYHDNGIGIPDTIVKDVFKIFVRGHQSKSGSGIGLYLVHQAVERLGGTIDLKSSEGVGTEFTIMLPNFAIL